MNVHTYGLEDFKDFFLYNFIFELIGVVHGLILILQSILVGLEGVLTLERLRRHDVMYASRLDASSQEPVDEGYSMKRVAVDADVLRFLYTCQEVNVGPLRLLLQLEELEVLVQVWIIDGVYTIDVLFILVVGGVS